MRRLGTNWAGIKPRPVTIDGIRFPSTGESKRYGALALEQKAGLIRNLKVHERLPLVVNGKKIGRRGWIEVDFVYERKNGNEWVTVYEDFKGVDTRESIQRRQLAEAIHGIKIQVTGGKPSRKKAA